MEKSHLFQFAAFLRALLLNLPAAFLLVLQSQAPIVPISISGTYKMLPRTGCCFHPGTISGEREKLGDERAREIFF